MNTLSRHQIRIIASLYHKPFPCILCFAVVTSEVSFFFLGENGDTRTQTIQQQESHCAKSNNRIIILACISLYLFILIEKKKTLLFFLLRIMRFKETVHKYHRSLQKKLSFFLEMRCIYFFIIRKRKLQLRVKL